MKLKFNIKQYYFEYEPYNMLSLNIYDKDFITSYPKYKTMVETLGMGDIFDEFITDNEPEAVFIPNDFILNENSISECVDYKYLSFDIPADNFDILYNNEEETRFPEGYSDKLKNNELILDFNNKKVILNQNF